VCIYLPSEFPIRVAVCQVFLCGGGKLDHTNDLTSTSTSTIFARRFLVFFRFFLYFPSCRWWSAPTMEYNLSDDDFDMGLDNYDEFDIDLIGEFRHSKPRQIQKTNHSPAIHTLHHRHEDSGSPSPDDYFGGFDDDTQDTTTTLVKKMLQT